MNNRERLLAILDHQPPDRIPWIPRILLWYNARKLAGDVPACFQGMTIREVEHALRIGTPARDGRVFTTRRENVEVVERREGVQQIIEYHTPVGSVRQVTTITPELERHGLPGRVEEFPCKGPADYKVWEYIVERTYWDAAYDAYRAYDAEVGPDGLPMISIGDVPFHEFMQALAGYEYGFYQIADYPAEVAHLLQTMLEVQRARLWPVVAQSPAKLVLHGVHLSSQFTPPRYFDQYIIPYYDGLMSLLHAHGIAVAIHADNDTSRIMAHIERAGWDMVECFVTAPMVPLTLERAREFWGTRMILWGCIPCSILSPSVSEEDFRDYIRNMFKVLAPGDAVILGAADNVMPDSLIERVEWISDYVEERGDYPLKG
ncbi:MAG: uroporphyrinogen decarboxylase family protein [Chloroflexota bacterium]